MRTRTWVTVTAALVLLATAVFSVLAVRHYQRFLGAPLRIPTAGIALQLESGKSYRDLVLDLRTAGLVRELWPWWLLGRLSEDTASLQAGEYLLEAGLTPPQLLAKLARGEVVQYSFTIVEGWRLSDLLRALAADPVLQQTIQGIDEEAIRERLDPGLDHLEGWFLPETYRFPRGATDLGFLRRAKAAMEAELARAWEQRRADLPYRNPYEVLIMASIIEKETAQPDERARIAGVFVRRLQKGMRLQTDPTVIYGLGAGFDGDLRYRDLRTDTPYNTYTRAGLPPTPIALPGRAALHAAVNPSDDDALYFVGRGDGRHHFSSSLEEHNRAVSRYQRGGR